MHDLRALKQQFKVGVGIPISVEMETEPQRGYVTCPKSHSKEML